jgi:hypothetical protein
MTILKLMNENQPPFNEGAQPAECAASAPEKLITIKEAANALGLPAWKLGRAASQGLFPTYSLLNSRRLVRLSEVIAAIEASRQGGDVQ